MKLKVKRLHPNAIIPTKSRDSDAGIDIYSCEDILIHPGETVKVNTGIAIELPNILDYGVQTTAALIWDRSGLGSKGIHRTAGVIDIGYRNNISVCLTNLNVGIVLQALLEAGPISAHKVWAEQSYQINIGDRIAQLLIQDIRKLEIEEVEELSSSEREMAGFGSSGR